MSKTLFSLGLGIGSKNSQNQWLEVFYPAPLVHIDTQTIQPVLDAVGYTGDNQVIELNNDTLKAIAKNAPNREWAEFAEQFATRSAQNKSPVLTVLATDSAPQNTPEGYLKLHLLSHRLVKPHGLDLTGIFAVLPNIAWTNQGPIDPAEVAAYQLKARLAGETLNIRSIDKFPKMTDYVVPKGVRIAATSRVRLGAYLGEGTTVMHEGFCNFNAGTLGVSMVEGRISSGVTVGNNSDLGGGCSTMGTLSGGGKQVISIGENCLIGANAGTGIPLGDRCTIESGLYITAGTKVTLIDENKQAAGSAKARELAGKSDLLFRRNSQSGMIECLTNKSAISLNSELHTHN
ncbi:2,3,4,5-tetrahydropyridine-2,6-dicarboxylate N-succinyltransferase [Celerinatantimonas diazotrophica]|uniref:2,3,4,5-tetrahydropyridine-2,6-dicarboxylate N-succinyltransferase n=1 Tax=Celerinatantimonas diazotrophica TaxID=412034 RepID=A0A4R1J9T7_9GAMM|nr:2,3,4,5-tetrahydropyridine-2,6-dicarboxylate N-succinyltransferase [Celerinatantimonas diazotrophica]TCK47280.1 2,3,4,5-tetrahydropyridine-2-carboxylate N-succinyltransferase [Celerinatantimonas diazotrophica]CAG9296052.1 2,3,4,5-tetrahydropyridine-2,6-dicarboxylate N-succinyltransferase [Celerinatantimonas diazotrophica]